MEQNKPLSNKKGTYPPSKSNSVSVDVRDVKKTFGDVEALRGVSLRVNRGEVFALLGPNGAGKTTLIRILTTLLRPDSGEVFITGRDIKKGADLVRNHIGLAGQYAAVDEILTGRENLELTGRLYHLSPGESRKRAREILDEFSLTFAGDRSLSGYSGGMRRRLDLAASLMGKPEVLFLDEPTTGLDPVSRKNMWRIIRRLAGEGTTILLTTQQLDEAERLADRIAIMNGGVIAARGTPDELKKKIGGHTLEIHLEHSTQTQEVLHLVGRFASDKERIEVEGGKIFLPVDHGTYSLLDVTTVLNSGEYAISDVALRRPNLDEVFLSITGEMPEDTHPGVAPPKASGWAA